MSLSINRSMGENDTDPPCSKALLNGGDAIDDLVAAECNGDQFRYALADCGKANCPPLPKRTVWCYGVGHILNDLAAAAWFTYLLIYLKEMFSLKESGTVFLAGQLADAAATPVVGVLSDMTQGWMSRTFGKRKTWYFWGSVLVALLFSLVWPVWGADVPEFVVGHPLPRWAHITYLAICAALFNFGWATVQVNHLALCPELTSQDSSRVQMYSVRNGATVLCNVAVFGMFTIISLLVDSESKVWHWLAIGCLIIGLFATLVFLIGVKERPLCAKMFAAQQRKRDEFPWYSWFKEKEFYVVGNVYMCARLLVNVAQVYLVIFAVDTLGMPATAQAIMPLALYVASFVTNFFMKRATEKYSMKAIITFGTLLSCTALTLLWLLAQGVLHWGYDNRALYSAYGFIMILGCGNAIVLVSALSLEARLVGNRTQSGAFVYGALSFLDKLSNGVVVFIINNLFTQGSGSGDDGNVTDAFRDRMSYIFAFVPLVSSLFGLATALNCSLAKQGDYDAEHTDYSFVNEDVVQSRLSQATEYDHDGEEDALLLGHGDSNALKDYHESAARRRSSL